MLKFMSGKNVMHESQAKTATLLSAVNLFYCLFEV